MTITSKAALKLTDFGSLRDAKKNGDGKRVSFAIVICAAVGVINRTSPTGDVYYGLKGSTEAHFTDGDVITADALYLPPVLLDPIRTALEAENAPRSLEFAFDIGAAKQKDGDDYVWDIIARVKPRAGDPLAALRESVKPKK